LTRSGTGWSPKKRERGADEGVRKVQETSDELPGLSVEKEEGNAKEGVLDRDTAKRGQPQLDPGLAKTGVFPSPGPPKPKKVDPDHERMLAVLVTSSELPLEEWIRRSGVPKDTFIRKLACLTKLGGPVELNTRNIRYHLSRRFADKLRSESPKEHQGEMF
jgi:hypothetical protein